MPFTYKGLLGLILNIVMVDNDSLFWVASPLKSELMCLLWLPDHFSSNLLWCQEDCIESPSVFRGNDK